MEVRDIQNAIKERHFRITDHADEEAQNGKITYDEIYFSVLAGKIIEDYADDKHYPSFLIYGYTSENEPVHSVWAYDKDPKWTVLVTVYRPDPDRWINWQRRI